MKPSRNEILLIATALVWIIAYAAWTADWTLGDMPYRLERAIRRIPVCIFGALCCFAMKFTLDRFQSRPWSVRLAIALACCLLASTAQAMINILVFYAIAPKWGPTSPFEIMQLAMVVAWVFLAWTALYFAIDAYARSEDARVRAAAAESAALRARQQALAQQLAPHFLFNALNTLSGLVMEGEPARAERIIVALSGLLRHALEIERRPLLPVKEEMAWAERYLAIEESRFEDRLRVRISMGPEVQDLKIPPMMLQ